MSTTLGEAIARNAQVTMQMKNGKVEELLRALQVHYQCSDEELSRAFYLREHASTFDGCTTVDICPGVAPPLGTLDPMEAIATVRVRVSVDSSPRPQLRAQVDVDIKPEWRPVLMKALEDDHGK
jgi:hypothetical protein